MSDAEDRRTGARLRMLRSGEPPPLASVTDRLYSPIGESSSLDEQPSAIPNPVLVEVATPMVEAVGHEYGEVAPSAGVRPILDVDLMGGDEVANVVWPARRRHHGGGVPSVLGSSQDGCDGLVPLIATDLTGAIDQLHAGIGGEEFKDLGEPSGVPVGVVPGHQVADPLTGR